MEPKYLYEDLREWLAAAKDLGEVKAVSGANTEEEIGMATELLHHTAPAPAALFDEIPRKTKKRES